MKSRIDSIQARINGAARRSGRDPNSVRLVAVSKTVSPGRVREAAATGLAVFGESYIQEARDKITELGDMNLTWHFIGHLQSNKVKYAVKLFDLIHTVDSMKLAVEIDRQAEKIGKVQNILLQINSGGESTKSGVDPAAGMDLVRNIHHLENIRVEGLMTIPPFFDTPEKVAPYFRELRELRDRIDAVGFPRVSMKELSMDMTGDFEVAIQEGATLVRIGTAIFGERA